jgi:hypothetical protein
MLGVFLDIKVFACMCVCGYIALFDGSVGLTLLLSGEREVLNYFLLYNHLSLPYDLAFWKGFLLNVRKRYVNQKIFLSF